MSGITEIDSANFEQEVIHSTTPVLVDFFGDLCAPCKSLLPILEEIGQEQNGRLKIVKMNAANNMEIAARYRVNAVPNLVLVSGGTPVGQKVGLMPKAELRKWVEETLR